MYVKSQTVKSPNGKTYTYYRLVHAYRDEGKVKHHVIGELGALSQDEAQKLARRFAQIGGIEWPQVEEDDFEINGMAYFGPPLLVEQLLEDLHLSRWVNEAVKHRRVKFNVVDALKVMLCAHLFKGGSRAELAVWDWQQKLFGHRHRTSDLDYQHLLRALNLLVGIKDQIEEKLFFHLVDLFDLKVDLVLYDLTSTYVEGQADWSELLKRGYSRDKRSDCKQIVIGLVVTREGFPITFRVFEGNRLDVNTLKEMVKRLESRFKIERCIWVSDTGLLSEENLETLKGSGYEYILGMGGEVRKDAKTAFQQCTELEQKEFKDAKFWDVQVPVEVKGKTRGCKKRGRKKPEQTGHNEGEDDQNSETSRRVIVIESEGRRQKTSAIFERRLEKVRCDFQALQKKVKKGKCVEEEDIRVAAEKILHECRVKKYFTYKAGRGDSSRQEDHPAIEQRKANAGKYALLTNSNLGASDVISAYRTLLAVEDAFQVLKHILDLRPFWHKCDVNVEGHVLLAVWSYLLYKTLERRMEQKGIDLSVPRTLNAIKEVRAVEVAVRDKPLWKLMKVPPEAHRALVAIGIDDVKGRFKQWARDAPPYDYTPRLEPEYEQLADA